MPDEFDFKNYKTMDDFSKTIEGTKFLHDLYLKAVNNPVRRQILLIVNHYGKISHDRLLDALLEKKAIKDGDTLKYHVDYLIKAFCIDKIEEKSGIFYEITQSGKVVEYLK